MGKKIRTVSTAVKDAVGDASLVRPLVTYHHGGFTTDGLNFARLYHSKGDGPRESIMGLVNKKLVPAGSGAKACRARPVLPPDAPDLLEDPRVLASLYEANLPSAEPTVGAVLTFPLANAVNAQGSFQLVTHWLFSEFALEHQVATSLREAPMRQQRLDALNEPHIAPLTDLVRRFRSRDGNEYPYFDPADGGVDARLLFLFEKPGPMTVGKGILARTGSGFISRDNDDPTAEATFGFMREAGVPRSTTVLWNTVPGWNGTRRIVSDELRSGIRDLAKLLSLLPKVRTIVLVGRKAAQAEQRILELGSFRIFKSAHPSPLVRASYPDQWRGIPAIWMEAAKHAGVWHPEG